MGSSEGRHSPTFCNPRSPAGTVATTGAAMEGFDLMFMNPASTVDGTRNW
jgi:hypothetical protein